MSYKLSLSIITSYFFYKKNVKENGNNQRESLLKSLLHIINCSNLSLYEILNPRKEKIVFFFFRIKF